MIVRSSSEEFLFHEAPHRRDVLEPTALVLKDRYIAPETDPTNSLYEIGRDVTAIPLKATSVIFERIEDHRLSEVSLPTSTESQKKHLFYLAHPLGSQYRMDTPAYYLTSFSPNTLGNISLEISKSRLGKTEFKVLVSSGKTWSDTPLFVENPQLLFNVRQKWAHARHIWTDSSDEEVAYEDNKDNQHKLVVTTAMGRERRDALVAAWCLKLWHDTSESSRAKRDHMERLTPPEEVLLKGGMRSMKNIGALGSLAGLG
ncbi:hypothetical protein F4774DRAFT_376386 [Daldinia eschscholtzii]|nr:hypothetical protein F4774DRAFT_376386 [Daldinia eschscholtzii]